MAMQARTFNVERFMAIFSGGNGASRRCNLPQTGPVL
jgi:hypothetical protein